MKKLVFAVLFLNATTLCCKADYKNFYLNLPDNSQNAALLISVAKEVNGATIYAPSGTGFWYCSDKSNYLITARHVLMDYDKMRKTYTPKYHKIKMLYHTEGFASKGELLIDLEQAFNQKSLICHNQRDVVAIDIGQSLGSGEWLLKPYVNLLAKAQKGSVIPVVRSTDCLFFKDVDLTADVVLSGFPSALIYYSMLTGQEFQFDPEMPLFRKGIIAGKNIRNKTFVIDGAAYGGNSGGPAFQILYDTPQSKNIRIIGVIIQYVPLIADSIWGVNFSTGVTYLQNSGYTIVEPMDNIIDMIESHERSK